MTRREAESSAARAAGRAVTVFGSADPLAGQPLYERARRLGQLLGRRGYAVVTGGYGGVMEAASRGASEVGARAIGVPCRIFGARAPNPYLCEIVETDDLFERTHELVRRGDAFVVLAGGAGTLAELTALWALDRAGCLGTRPVVLLDDVYPRLLDLLARERMLEPAQIERCTVTSSPEAAVAAVAGEGRR